MREGEYYSKIVNRAVDISFADKREDLPSIPRSVFEVIRPNTNKVKRLEAILSIIRKSLPEKVWEKSGIRGVSRDLSHLPVDLEQYTLKHRVGSGLQSDCFLLEPIDKENNETWVLKLFQVTENNLSKVESKARTVNEDYKTLTGWYNDIEDVIPKQFSFIGEHFQLPEGRPALYVLQRFLGTNLKGVFENFNDKEWDKLCEENPQIKEDLRQFAQITKEHLEQDGLVPDLAGTSNLVIAEQDNKSKLFFLDPDGIRKFDVMDPTSRAKYESRLKLLYKRAGIE